MLDTDLLQTVTAVVREGSFERAARALHVSPSAVSQRIRLIEERLGAVLIVRGTPCTATDAGSRLCRHAETVALLEHELRRNLPGLARDAGETARATLRIAVNADSLDTWFVDALALHAQSDDTLIDVAVADQDHTGAWLRRGHVLAAVTALAKPVQGCKSRKLGALRYAATASPAFVARWFGAGVNTDSLARAPSLVFDHNDQLQAQWVRRLLRRDVVLPAHRLPSTRAFVGAALGDVGWGLNPLALVQAHLAAGRLVELVPGCHFDVPLYWQAANLPLPSLEGLTRHVLRAAAGSLD